MRHGFKLTYSVLFAQGSLIALTAILLSNQVDAQIEWTNTSNTNAYWQITNNWSPSAVPGPTDVASFSASRSYQVWWNSLTGNQQIGGLTVKSGNVTFLNQLATPRTLTVNGIGANDPNAVDVSGGGSSLTIRGVNVHSLGGATIGANAALTVDGHHAAGTQFTTDLELNVKGELNSLSGGIISSNSGIVGSNNSVARATISGANTQWANSGTVIVGTLGEGELNVESGALVTSENGFVGWGSPGQTATGTTNVSGTGSRWTNNADLVIGGAILLPGSELGTGVLNIQDGGLVSSGNSYLGVVVGAGQATVSGNNSQWNTTNTMTVGHHLLGTLEILNGGTVSNEVGYVGRLASATGNVNVSGAGSHWDNRNSLIVGAEGVGFLNIENGGRVSNGFGSIGAVAGSSGAVVASGSGSKWENSGSLLIGGFLAEGGTGELTIENNAKVSSGGNTYLWSTGTLNLNGGELQTQSFENTQGGNFNFNGGRLTVDGGSFLPGTPSFSIDSSAADIPTLVIRNGATASLADRMTVGAARKGNLIIDGGGSVSNAISIIGDKATANGVATISGAGSLWDQTSLTYIGRNGIGTMNISDGGWVKHDTSSAAHIAFGSTSNGTVTVTDPGPGWTNSGELNVGTGGSGAMELRLGGQVTNTTAYVGRNTSASGEVTVSDNGSHWSNSGNLYVGDEGHGTLTIENGGKVSNTLKAYVGHAASSIGEVIVSGSGSHWENDDDLFVGYFGKGTLDIVGGGRVSNQKGFVGANINPKASIANVTGEGSVWDNSGILYVGDNGAGVLNVSMGGQVFSEYGFLGYQSTANGEANVSGEKSQWIVNNDLRVGDAGVGELNILDRGKVSNLFGYIGWESDSHGTATVAGFESRWENQNDLRVGASGSGTLNIFDQGHVTNRFGFVGSGAAGEVNVGGAGARWTNQFDLSIGESNQGTLNIDSAGRVISVNGLIGNEVGGNGVANVRGAGSNWQNTESLAIGYEGVGTLNIESEGVVSSQGVVIGSRSGSMGAVNVRFANSRLDTQGIAIASSGTGTLDVRYGGKVNSITGRIASTPFGGDPAAQGDVTVNGLDSVWNNTSDLRIGLSGSGTLNIQNGGEVLIGGTTSIGAGGVVNLEGGRFEFGQTTIPEFTSINAVSGSMAGNLIHESYTNLGSLAGLRNPAVDISEVSLLNSGILYGDGAVDTGVKNQSAGQLQLSAGDWMRFGGSDSTNDGEINNFGGTILFASGLANNASGFVTGRGVFGADGGWTNKGVMAFSGTTDILGDVNVVEDGRVVTSGGATTTFYDDVVHNGSEIRTAAGSQSVFFGSVSGDSSFTGLGTVYMEGDLRPGNSPGILSFEGDLVLGAGADTFIELAGILPGEFDQLQIDHDLVLNGGLSVALYDGFQLSLNEMFLIGDVGGLLSGQFDGLSEGDLVGNYGGVDLFITYSAGGGNGVGLFTPVPEPGALAFLTAGVMGFALLRRRRLQK